jgi:hypothetical protein
MSETQLGPAWWQASDGKWNSPELHPREPGVAASVAPSGRGTR